MSVPQPYFAAKTVIFCRNCHSRTAEEDTIRVLVEEQCERVLLHAYGGPTELALQAALQKGFFFSIPPCFSLSQKVLGAGNAEIRLDV